LLEHANRDHDQTRCDVKKSVQLGPHRGLPWVVPTYVTWPSFSPSGL
jgi:hypothetical protein